MTWNKADEASTTALPAVKNGDLGSAFLYLSQDRWQMEESEAMAQGHLGSEW